MKRTTPSVKITNVNGKELNNDVIKYYYEKSKDELFINSLINNPNYWERINHCNAYYAYTTSEYNVPNEKWTAYRVVFIKSYNTIVGAFFPEFNALILFGRYSMTTYQHIAKFRNNFRYQISYEYNMEYVNWFWGD